MEEKKDKIRICHLSSVHFANDTRLFYRECISLARHYEVHLVAIGQADGEWYGVKIHPIRQHRSRLPRFLLNIPAVFYRALRVNARIYHFHDPELILVGIVLRLFGKQVIYDVHEDVSRLIRLKKWVIFPRLVTRIYKIFEWFALKLFHIVVSEDAYQKLYPRTPTTVIHNYAFAERLEIYRRPERNSGAMNLFYIGSIDDLYCIFETLEAIHILRTRGYDPNVTFVGYVSPRIKKQIEALPFFNLIRNKLNFHGYLSSEAGFKFSTEATIGICLVNYNANSYESYPRKMFEYMSIGLPFVTSDFPLYKNVAEKYDCGLCVNPDFPADIADAFELLIKDQAKRNQMSRNGIQAALEQFNWGSEEEKLLELYRKLLS